MRIVPAVITLVIGIGAGFIIGRVVYKPKPATPPNGEPFPAIGPNDSPVHVQGGSLILKADKDWASYGQPKDKQLISNDCVDVTLLRFDKMVADGAVLQPSVSQVWQMRVFVSKADDSGPDSIGVLIHPDTQSCDTDEHTSGRKVIIEPIDKADDLHDPGDKKDRTYDGKSGCDANKTHCAEMAAVELDDAAGQHTYRCAQAKNCMVWIGKLKLVR